MKQLYLAALVAAAAAALPVFAQSTTAGDQGEPGWAPSPYGADDRIGAMNNLSAAKTVAAADLVSEGKVYALGVVTGPETPSYPGRGYRAVITQSAIAGEPLGPDRIVTHDDLIVANMGIGTQIDGFAHMGIDNHYYNGRPAAEVYGVDGVRMYGTQDIPPAATRGILLDMAKLFGVDALPANTAFNREEIDRAAAAAGVEIGSGDVVLFHTGWMAAKAESDPAAYIAAQPGLGLEGAEYLADLGVVMVGADSAALEALPGEDPDRPFRVHQHLLTKTGVHVLENIDTNALAADGATEFLFVLGQPRFAGTVQVVINPVAIR
ncbi:hypothetical protein B5C34_04370 [Pacificimonas flava]|uniref:Polyketide cyclase n=2 Tax=Pacificimonas TaxID=1960290 RepID=A0A219B345_9SPHN|nr:MULTISPECIES: cyclase family protein [Pacificimonas]MBZ6377547.1 cyclase family protein [Pacificimonas aurantium]OWV32760.1 hypothetical protein B5C34_04370 [Pacificimonas flava]